MPSALLDPLKRIQQPVAAEMAEFEQVFRKALSSKVGLLDRITHYLVRRKGKQLRPMLVFLSAKLHGTIGPATHRGASFLEMIHTATLVHDDVVDDSYYRRGFLSLNALWKNKIAVLVGDYLLAKGQLLVTGAGEFQTLELVSEAVREMSEGELLQIEKARRLDIDEAIYYEIIRQKTASLITACCAVGASSVGADAESIDRMKRLGYELGMAFQIKDDLFDYERINKTGKPSGIDIKEQKMTLPLIRALSEAGNGEKRRLMRAIRSGNNDPEQVAKVLEFVRQSGGVAYAEQVMNRHRANASTLLETYRSDPAAEALRQLADFVVERDR